STKACAFILGGAGMSAPRLLVLSFASNSALPRRLPGGTIMDGESPLVGMVREVSEETGLHDLIVVRKLSIRRYYFETSFGVIRRRQKSMLLSRNRSRPDTNSTGSATRRPKGRSSNQPSKRVALIPGKARGHRRGLQVNADAYTHAVDVRASASPPGDRSGLDRFGDAAFHLRQRTATPVEVLDPALAVDLRVDEPRLNVYLLAVGLDAPLDDEICIEGLRNLLERLVYVFEPDRARM